MRGHTLARPVAEGLTVLDEAPFAHLAWVDDAGAPQMRSVHAFRFEDTVVFHGAKVSALARGDGLPVVLQAETILAEIPSYFLDAERACPATTLYRSVQVEGRLRPIDDVALKTRVLNALMKRFQPQGGHAPIEADHELYRGAVKGVGVTQLVPERVRAKANLAQNKSPALKQTLVTALWARGAPGDLETIEWIRRGADVDPAPPAWRSTPATLHVWVPPEDAEVVAEPLGPLYWNRDLPLADIAAAHRASNAWVVARDDRGSIVGTARAVTDDTKHAWIYDVWVDPAWRKRGVASGLMALLLDHPRVRGVRKAHLHTRDAEPLYRKFGFDMKPMTPFSYMMLERPELPSAKSV